MDLPLLVPSTQSYFFCKGIRGEGVEVEEAHCLDSSHKMMTSCLIRVVNRYMHINGTFEPNRKKQRTKSTGAPNLSFQAPTAERY